MQRKLLLILVGVAGLAGYLLFLDKQGGGLREGEPAPSFYLPNREHGAVGLERLRGEVVLLNFWATWCPPCVTEMPSLGRLQTRFEGQKFKVLAVSVDEDGWPAVDRFLKKYPVNLTILLDVRGDIAARYGTNRLPESFLIDQKGTVVKKYLGPRDWTDPKIVSEIEGYLNGT